MPIKKNTLRILGCSGGIGGSRRTTSMLLDHDILIDAGSGVGDLSIDELKLIDHIFITHSHLDHICFIPFLLDTVIGLRSNPLTVHTTQKTWDIIKKHIFNWEIWPDFTTIPDPSNPILRFNAIEIGQATEINERKITALPANHVVPAIGFQINNGNSSLVFTGDTDSCDELWEVINNINNLEYLIIETAFGEKEKILAQKSKHLCPSSLKTELLKLDLSPNIFITHLKPGEEEYVLMEIESLNLRQKPLELAQSQIIEF